MPVSIEFRFSHSYEGGPKGIEIPIQLKVGNHSVAVNASLDTGAAFCIIDYDRIIHLSDY